MSKLKTKSDVDLSVIILSYNTKEITGRCLGKLKIAKDYCEDRLKNKIAVVVLDNGSQDGSAQMLKADFPWIKLIVSKTNLGFSQGNNLAMKRVKTPYILLLNSDVYLGEDSLYKALAYFRVNLNCSVLGARLNYPSGTLQPSCGNLPHPLNIIFWILGLSRWSLMDQLISSFHPRGQNFFGKAREIGWVMGAFFMLRRQVFDKTGGFDENLFMYMEEVEWCKRIKEGGFQIWYVPMVEVIHLQAASTNFDLSSSFLNELKGIKYYLKKYYHSYYFPVKLFLIGGLTLRVIAFSLLGQTQRARVYMEGLKVI